MRNQLNLFPNRFFRLRGKSILFINPDYHCTFAYKQSLEKIGWRAKIFVPALFPNQYLFDESNILKSQFGKPTFRGLDFRDLFVFIRHFLGFKFHFYYGRPPLQEDSKRFSKFFLGKEIWNIFLFLSKLSRAKIIYIPSGCRDEFNRSTFSLLDEGKVCGNCAFYEKCDEVSNNYNLQLMAHYSDLIVGAGFFTSPFLNLHTMKWKAIDLVQWSPGLVIPDNFVLPHSDSIRIFHASTLGDRDKPGKNIKGSYFLEKAITRLQAEGYRVELLRISHENIKDVRFFQIQADIVVDQLIYGQWGSVGIESMALGKPVICYIRDSWYESFLNAFPEYNEIPIFNADTNSIYDSLKFLIDNPSVRIQLGEKARRFAEQHFDSDHNSLELTELLKTLT